MQSTGVPIEHASERSLVKPVTDSGRRQSRRPTSSYLEPMIIRFITISAIITLLLGFGAGLSYAGETSAAGIRAATSLVSRQEANGRIGNLGASGWAVQALSANGQNTQSVLGYLLSQADILNLNSATELERTILASLAANHDPQQFNGLNLVEKLVLLVNNGQIGDPTRLNDDSFGILALLASGSANQDVLANSLAYLSNSQLTDGSWSWQRIGAGDTNSTAVTIQALQLAQSRGYNHTANLILAINYLRSAHNSDGGFSYLPGQASDAASTSWVIQAILAMGQRPEDWIKNEHNPYDFLLSMQTESGGVRWRAGEEPDLLTTSYAAMALARKPLPIASLAVPSPSPTPMFSPFPSPSPSPAPALSPTILPPLTPSPLPSPSGVTALSPKASLSPLIEPSPSPASVINPAPSPSHDPSPTPPALPTPISVPSPLPAVTVRALTVSNDRPPAKEQAQAISLATKPSSILPIAQPSPIILISAAARPIEKLEDMPFDSPAEAEIMTLTAVKGESAMTDPANPLWLSRIMMVLGISLIVWTVRKPA